MINPNKTSEILSIGSSRRLDDLVRCSGMVVTHFLLLPPTSQRIVELNQS